MCKMLLLFVPLLLCATAYSDDLCLLEISNQSELEKVRVVAGHANGFMDGKFVVNLKHNKMTQLELAGIEIEILIQNCMMKNLYFVAEEHNKKPMLPLSFSPIYSTQQCYLMELERTSISILERAGYMVESVMEKITPFFYNAPRYRGLKYDGYPTDSIADLVIQDSLYSYVTRLESFYTRFTPTDSCLAARD